MLCLYIFTAIEISKNPKTCGKPLNKDKNKTKQNKLLPQNQKTNEQNNVLGKKKKQQIMLQPQMIEVCLT